MKLSEFYIKLKKLDSELAKEIIPKFKANFKKVREGKLPKNMPMRKNHSYYNAIDKTSQGERPLSTIITRAFIWHSTPEGREYWEPIYNKIWDKEVA